MSCATQFKFSKDYFAPRSSCLFKMPARTVAASNEKKPTATTEKTPPTTADSDARLSSPSTLLPSSAKGLQDTPVSQISTDDDAVADGAKPYDPAAVGKKSHDRALARAIRKLKNPSPKSAKPILDNTPTSQIQRSWSGASSDSGTSRFCTPTAQVRPSLCQTIHSRNCLFY